MFWHSNDGNMRFMTLLGGKVNENVKYHFKLKRQVSANNLYMVNNSKICVLLGVIFLQSCLTQLQWQPFLIRKRLHPIEPY
jgi:hypothetical protein